MSGTSKWLVAGLVLSVAMNIFIVGVVIGKNIDGRRPPVSHGGWDRYNIRSLSKYLTKEERADVRALLARHLPEIAENKTALRQNEQAIRAIIEADTVDVEQLNVLLDDNERYAASSRWPVRRSLLEYVAGLDHETRLAVARDMFRDRSRGGERRHRDPNTKPPHDDFGPPSGREPGEEPPPDGRP